MEYLYTKISIMTNIKIFEWDCETDEISCYGVLAEQRDVYKRQMINRLPIIMRSFRPDRDFRHFRRSPRRQGMCMTVL